MHSDVNETHDEGGDIRSVAEYGPKDWHRKECRALSGGLGSDLSIHY